MNHRLLTLLLPLTLLMACGGTASSQEAAGASTEVTIGKYQDLSVEEFAGKVGGDNTILLDVRTPGETAGGIIEGAIELDFRSPNFAEELAQLDQSKTFLVYCASGIRSGKACKLLQEAGVKEVYNLKGGYNAWK